MSETLEQRALRIAKEMFGPNSYKELLPECDWVAFARRLTTEQGEPVAQVQRGNTGPIDNPDRRVHWLIYSRDIPFDTYLYAATPQDALDAKRYRILRQHTIPKMLSDNMCIPWVDIPNEMSIEEKIDSLCDIMQKGLA